MYFIKKLATLPGLEIETRSEQLCEQLAMRCHETGFGTPAKRTNCPPAAAIVHVGFSARSVEECAASCDEAATKQRAKRRVDAWAELMRGRN